MAKIKFQGLSPRFELYITEEQKVIVYCKNMQDANSKLLAGRDFFDISYETPVCTPTTSNSTPNNTFHNDNTSAKTTSTTTAIAKQVRKQSVTAVTDCSTPSPSTSFNGTVASLTTEATAKQVRKQSITAVTDCSTPSPSTSFNGTLASLTTDSVYVRGRILKFHPTDGHFETDTQYDDYAPSADSYRQEMRIHGIVGILDLSFGKYLFYVKEKKCVGFVGDKAIFQVVSGGYVVISRKPYLTLSEEQQEYEDIEGILSILASGNMFFSYDYDITNSTQSFFNTVAGPNIPPGSPTVYFPCDCANHDFWWNRYLQMPLIERMDECREFIIPLICGYVGHFNTIIPIAYPMTAESPVPSDNSENGRSEQEADILVIARTSRHRVGTRYTRRGVDVNGNVANYVETELIVRTTSGIASHVQVRGSVPWLWSQLPDMSYKPSINICDSQLSDKAIAAMKLHFQRLQKIYSGNGVDHGSIACINLLDHVGYEAALGSCYTRNIELLKEQNSEFQNITYDAFDLNPKKYRLRHVADTKAQAETIKKIFGLAKVRADEHDIFVASLKTCQPSYTALAKSTKTGSEASNPVYQHKTAIVILKTQKGVVRTNCLDCLDRTNMVQFIVSCCSLLSILHEQSLSSITQNGSLVKYSAPSQTENELEHLLGKKALEKYRMLWVNHGDHIGRQYTGTGALHSSFIRYGSSESRQNYGRGRLRRKIRDAILAITRFYLNNYADAYRQDFLDIFHGYHRGSYEQGDNDYYPLLESQEYVEALQSLQRFQSHEIINALVSPKQTNLSYSHLLSNSSIKKASETNSISYYEWMSRQITSYLILFQRHFAPRRVINWWDYMFVLIWLFIVTFWWYLIGKPNKWTIARLAKSGNRNWEGDERPFTLIKS